jgi:hypothetical protein
MQNRSVENRSEKIVPTDDRALTALSDVEPAARAFAQAMRLGAKLFVRAADPATLAAAFGSSDPAVEIGALGPGGGAGPSSIVRLPATEADVSRAVAALAVLVDRADRERRTSSARGAGSIETGAAS